MRPLLLFVVMLSGMPLVARRQDPAAVVVVVLLVVAAAAVVAAKVLRRPRTEAPSVPAADPTRSTIAPAAPMTGLEAALDEGAAGHLRGSVREGGVLELVAQPQSGIAVAPEIGRAHV